MYLLTCMPWHLQSLGKTVVILGSSLGSGNSAVPLGIDFPNTDFMNIPASSPLPYELHLEQKICYLHKLEQEAQSQNSFIVKLLRPK